MASFERFDDMCDNRLKPKILRNLLSDYVPNEKQPFVDFQSLSKVVSTISTHKLLSEDQKLQAKSKSAVDEWVERFLALVSSDMNPESSRIIRVTSCTSISDLLTRLSRFANTKKEAVSHAAKVILPIIKLMEEDSSEALWEGIVNLLSTIVILFPAAFHSSYDTVEEAIASKIFSAKTSSSLLKHCSPKLIKEILLAGP
ncbi:hypothetical protein F2Q70_00021311 [Brassica cretica]|uniref:Pre-rRNA-processing protein RIX1 N-terminal domain-containing protein n=1 Tax=Brassica cretica TaxID=69181 RepID=A0A8S9GPB6_BRACR|nr:hypothetical protein F2Q70_00021311 [Brassica cretica]